MGKIGTPPKKNIVGKLKSDYLFSSQKRADCLFSAFSRSEYLFQQNASPPPPNQMVVPQLRTQNGSTSLGEKSDEQETRAMLAAGQCRCRIEFWPHWISTHEVLIQRAVLRIQRIFHVKLQPPRQGVIVLRPLRRIKFWPPVESWPQVFIPRWIITPGPNSTLNGGPESWFNV